MGCDDRYRKSNQKETFEVGIDNDLMRLRETICVGMENIIRNGAAKHGIHTWMEKDNKSLAHENNIESIFRHIMRFREDPTAWNEEEQCYHLENAICRLAMALYRIKEGSYKS